MCGDQCLCARFVERLVRYRDECIVTVVVTHIPYGWVQLNRIVWEQFPLNFVHERLPLKQDACGNVVLLFKLDDLDICDIRHVYACKSLLVHDPQFGYRRSEKVEESRKALRSEEAKNLVDGGFQTVESEAVGNARVAHSCECWETPQLCGRNGRCNGAPLSPPRCPTLAHPVHPPYPPSCSRRTRRTGSELDQLDRRRSPHGKVVVEFVSEKSRIMAIAVA